MNKRDQYDDNGKLVIRPEDKLPSEFKEKLLNALRGNMYKKCEGTLHNPKEHYSSNFKGEYCVMGLAAHIAGAKDEDLEDEAIIDNSDIKKMKIKSTFPKVLSANYKEGAIQEHLIEMNDDGASFKKIATYIEKNL